MGLKFLLLPTKKLSTCNRKHLNPKASQQCLSSHPLVARLSLCHWTKSAKKHECVQWQVNNWTDLFQIVILLRDQPSQLRQVVWHKQCGYDLRFALIAAWKSGTAQQAGFVPSSCWSSTGIKKIVPSTPFPTTVSTTSCGKCFPQADIDRAPHERDNRLRLCNWKQTRGLNSCLAERVGHNIQSKVNVSLFGTRYIACSNSTAGVTVQSVI